MKKYTIVKSLLTMDGKLLSSLYISRSRLPVTPAQKNMKFCFGFHVPYQKYGIYTHACTYSHVQMNTQTHIHTHKTKF